MGRKTVAFLTMEDPGDYVTDYDLCFAAMAARGWTVETVAWRQPDCTWDRYDAVYLCSAWDYPLHLDEFLETVQRVHDSSAVLVNEQSLVSWNIRKSYLRDLASRGADVVPSLWQTDFNIADVSGWFSACQADTLIIKPEVGANAQDTFVLQDPLDAGTQALLETGFRGRNFLVQPFIESILSEGEYSLCFFAGNFSHAILKTPRPGDFRSQEEHGSTVRSVHPEASLLRAAHEILRRVQPQPVYARVDLVRGPDGRFLLMELELVEPALYLRMDDAAPARFAAAFDDHFNEKTR